MEVNNVSNIISTYYDLYNEVGNIYIPSDIIGLIDTNPELIGEIKDGNIIKYINESRDKYYKELELLIDASEEQTQFLNRFEQERRENELLTLKLEKTNKELLINLEEEERNNIEIQKQARVYKVVSWLILVILVILLIYGTNMFINNSDTANSDFKDIALLVIGICTGAVSSFVGSSKPERQKRQLN